jgi:hypothetical protein
MGEMSGEAALHDKRRVGRRCAFDCDLCKQDAADKIPLKLKQTRVIPGECPSSTIHHDGNGYKGRK